ncbi:delta(8)-fatty-acid desaturase-like protein [Tanacetum coccineum]
MVVMVVKAAVVRRSWCAWRCGDDDGGTRVVVAVTSCETVSLSLTNLYIRMQESRDIILALTILDGKSTKHNGVGYVGCPSSNGNGRQHFARVSNQFATLYTLESSRRGEKSSSFLTFNLLHFGNLMTPRRSLLNVVIWLLVYENKRNLIFIDAFDVKPIGGDSPKILLQFLRLNSVAVILWWVVGVGVGEKPDVKLKREFLRTKYDGTVTLDWVSGNAKRLPEDTPIPLLLGWNGPETRILPLKDLGMNVTNGDKDQSIKDSVSANGSEPHDDSAFGKPRKRREMYKASSEKDVQNDADLHAANKEHGNGTELPDLIYENADELPHLDMTSETNESVDASFVDDQSSEHILMLRSLSESTVACVTAGKVYDVTEWVKIHPGGDIPLMNLAGQDVTDAFIAFHPGLAWQHLNKLFTGYHLKDYQVSKVLKDYRKLASEFAKAGMRINCTTPPKAAPKPSAPAPPSPPLAALFTSELSQPSSSRPKEGMDFTLMLIRYCRLYDTTFLVGM